MGEVKETFDQGINATYYACCGGTIGPQSSVFLFIICLNSVIFSQIYVIMLLHMMI